MNNIQQAPDPSNPTGQIVKVPTRDRSNQNQVGTVLAIIQTLNPYLFKGGPENMDVEKESGLAASVTFMKACDRLDTILGDNTRWSADDGPNVVDEIRATQQSIQQYYITQKNVLEKMARPSRLFTPKIAKAGEEFVAFFVASEFPGGVLVGRGATPEKAMADFDAAFDRIPADQFKLTPEADSKVRGVEAAKKPTKKKSVKK